MTRITKKPDVRKLEILNAARELFFQEGYDNTSVDSIIKKLDIAKGTLYYYFKNKEELLGAIVDDTLNAIIKQAQTLAENRELKAIEKLQLFFSVNSEESANAKKTNKGLHHPSNRELHEKTNVQIIKRLSPVLAEIVDQGVKEKCFKVNNTLETVQFLLTASQFLFDEELFGWNKNEILTRQIVMREIIEKSLGAKKGSLQFLQKR